MMISALTSSTATLRFNGIKRLSQQEQDALKQDFATLTGTKANEVKISPTGKITINNSTPGRALFPTFLRLSKNEAQTGVKFENGRFSFKGYPLGWTNP